jgi:hypothetical protein
MRVGEDKKLSKPKIVSHTRFVSFLNELKERKVLRVAIAYIVVTWIVIQVAESTFEALKLPDWSNSLMVIFIMIGFPFALILAWAYELTPDGLVEDKDGQSGNRSSLQNSRNETARVNGKSPSPSIAVL